MSDFTETLIIEVEKRPGLYNMALPEYSDRNLKQMLWEEVTKAVVPAWEDLESKEKTAKGKEVQKRWKSLRDCFRRELATQKNKPSGSGASKRRTYLYFEQLKFLIGTFEQRATTSSLDPLGDVNDDEAAADMPLHDTVQSIPRRRAEKRHSSTFEHDLIKLLENKTSTVEAVDDDKQFLLSLLPMMKQFDATSKLDVRVAILNAIKQVRNDIIYRPTQAAQHEASIYPHRPQTRMPQYAQHQTFDSGASCSSWQPPNSPSSVYPQSTTTRLVQSSCISAPSPTTTESSELLDLDEPHDV